MKTRGDVMEILVLVLCSSCSVFVLMILALKAVFSDKSTVEKRVEKMTGAHIKATLSARRHPGKNGHIKLWPSFKNNTQKRLLSELSAAGVLLRPEEFLTIWMSLALVPALVSALFGAEFIVSISLALLGTFLPYTFIKKAKNKRILMFERQLSDSLIIMSNCLRSGLSFQQAVQSIAKDMPEPISKEFGKVTKELNLGLPIEKTLANMVERIESKDLVLIVSAILIQRQTGGNLSEILDSIAGTITERLKIKGEIRVQTATGRTSGLVVGLLPAFIMAILMLINPSYMGEFFNNPLGIAMLSAAAGLEFIGFMCIRAVVNVKF